MSKSKGSKEKTFPLAAVLRDLALLRASGQDVSSLVPSRPHVEQTDGARSEIDGSVESSYSFAEEGRRVVKIHHRGILRGEGEKVEEVREELEELAKGLEGRAQ